MISNTMIEYFVNEITSMNPRFLARIKFTELAMNKVQQLTFID